MLPFFNSNNVIGLIDKKTAKVDVVDKINIVLTPSFYWVKKAFLEVKFSAAALKYAPSIFEGMLPEGNYAYYAVKKKDGFLFFAYDPDQIIQSLKDKGINASQIGGVYFAQNEMDAIKSPVVCNQDDVIILHNDIVLQVKKYLVDESSIVQNIDTIQQLSKHKVILHKSSVTHSVKELKPLLFALVALISLYATQLFFSNQQYEALLQKPSVFKEYKLPATFIQNSSIEKKLRKKFKEQKSFRKLMSAILKLPLLQRERINSLNYEKKQFKIVFDSDNHARLRDVQLSLQKSLGSLVKVDISKNIMQVKIK